MTATDRTSWPARILTAIPVLFLLFDIAIKFAQIQPVVDSYARLQIPLRVNGAVAGIELVCLALYLMPRTAVLGAILITGFLGGAVLSHVRIGDPLLTHALFPTYVGALLWVGLYLREPRLRVLVPLR